MNYLDDKEKFLIIGAARSGISSALFLSEKNKTVLLNDSKEYDKLLAEGYGIEKVVDLDNVKLALGRAPLNEEVLESNAIILSPGVPPDIPACNLARENGIDVISEVEFANRFFKGNIVAITGTNGKTTTTYLTQALLSAGGKNAFVCGNIGLPFIDYADSSNENSVATLEISSFQLSMCEYMKPKIAVVTNITPDHLDRHKTMENYIAAKANVFKNMDSDGILVLNYDDTTVRGFADKANCNVKFFSLENKDCDAYYADGSIWLKEFGEVAKVSDLKIIGPHNTANAMCALLCAYYLDCDMTKVKEALTMFSPVEHRVEFVRELDGVKYINDSKGTNPDATITAVKAFECPLIMIMGGYDKKSDFNELFDIMKDKVKHIFLLGQTSDIIAQTAEKHGLKCYTKVESLEEAVNKSRECASDGDCVLLSPACASWGMFDNFEQRGTLFKEYVNNL